MRGLLSNIANSSIVAELLIIKKSKHLSRFKSNVLEGHFEVLFIKPLTSLLYSNIELTAIYQLQLSERVQC